MGFLDFLKGAGEAIAQPFEIVGRGVNEVLPGTQRAREEERAYRLKNMDNNTKLISRYQKLLKEGKNVNGGQLSDEERKRYQRLIDDKKNENKALQSDNRSSTKETIDNTNKRKFAASAADIALTIGSAGTYGAGASTARTGARLGAKEISRNIAKQGAKAGIKKTLARTAAPNIIEGMLGGSLGALQQDDPNYDSVASASILGGLLGGVVPTGQYLFGRPSKYVNKAVTRSANDAIDFTGVDRAAGDLVDAASPRATTKVATTAGKKASGGVDDLIDTVSPTRQVADVATDTTESLSKKPAAGSARELLQSKIKTTSQIQKATRKPLRDRAKENFFDKLSPINDLVKDVESRTGRKLATEENPYELGRLYAGMPAKVKLQINEFSKVVKDVPDIDAYQQLGIARRIIGRPDIKSVISVDDANRVIREIQQQFSPEDFAKLNRAVDGTVEYNKALFRALGDAGIFEKGSIEDIIEKNPDYFTRFNIVNKLLKEAQSGVDQLKPGQSFNLSRQNVLKALKGAGEDAEILDPIESIVKSTDSIMRTIEKNRIFRSMQKLADDTDLVKPLRNADDVAKRISLSVDNKELRPIRNKVARMAKTRAVRAKRLASEIDKLNKAGLNRSLKKGGKEALPDFTPGGLGGVVPTSRAGQAVATTADEKRLFEALGEAIPTNPSKMGPADTRKFLNALVEADDKTLKAIRKKIASREPKLASMLDEVSALKKEYDTVATQIRNNIDEASQLSDLKLPDGYERISGWRNGIREDIAIPSEIAQAYKGLNSAQLDQATSFINKVNQVMKTSVTSLNVPFAVVRNPIRDFKTMASNSKNIPPTYRKIIKSWIKGAWEGYKGVTGRRGGSDLYEDWIASGGGGSGIYSRLDSGEKISKNIANTVKGRSIKNAKDIPGILADIARIPVDAVQNAGAILESAPRLAEFQAAVDQGKSLATAALDSRNVTVDFNQSGKVGQVLNSWIPFLNARLQGNKKLLEAAARDPKRFVKIYGMLTAVPIAAAAALNAEHQDVMDQIPGYVKDTNFLIVFGDRKDESGNFTDVLKIPKSDLDKIFGNPLENFLDFAMGKDSQNVGQTLMEFANNISPVDFVKDGSVNASRALGGITPVAFKAPLEFVTNKNLYFDSPTVSDSLARLPNEYQVRDDTSGTARALAGATGQSPLKVEQFLRSTTGSLSTSDPVSDLAGTVVGANGNAVKNEFYQVLDKTEPMKNEASLKINEALAAGDIVGAQQIAEAYNAKLREMFSPWAARYGKYATADLQELYNSQKLNLSSRSIQQRQRTLTESGV